VVRTHEPLFVTFGHQFDDLLFLGPNLVGEDSVAGVHVASVLVGTLATDHILHLLLPVELGVVDGVDLVHEFHLGLLHLVLGGVDGFSELLVLSRLLLPLLGFLVVVGPLDEVVGQLVLVVDDFVDFVFLFQVFDDQFGVLLHVLLVGFLALHVVLVE